MRKKLLSLMAIVVALSMLFIAGPVMAEDNAAQTVGYQVDAINELSVSGPPADLVVSAAVAGQEPTPVTENSTTYSITTNAGTDAKKITAALDTDMPGNVTLAVTLGDLTGATSASEVSLSATAADVVTGIDSIAADAKTIAYKLTALVAAGIVSNADKTVTFTIVATP